MFKKLICSLFLVCSFSVISANHSVNTTNDVYSLSLSIGDVVHVKDIDATYYIKNSTYQIGDLILGGSIAQLQPYQGSKFNVRHFLSFDDAAIRAKTWAQSKSSGSLYGHVYVPAGWYNLSSQTNESAVWHVDAAAEFSSPANYSLTGKDNISYLTGSVFRLESRGNLTSFTIGDSDWSWIEDIRGTVVPNSQFNVVANGGSGAASFYATTGDQSYSEGNIAAQFYCMNTSSIKQNCWSSYFESERAPWAGTTTALEITISNYGTWDASQRILPSGSYGPSSGVTSGIWLSGAAGNGFYSEEYNPIQSGSGITFVSGVSGAGFDTGLVFLKDAFSNSTNNEIMRTFCKDQKGSKIWAHAGGYNPKAGIEFLCPDGNNGQVDLVIRDIGQNWHKVSFNKNGLYLPSGAFVTSDKRSKNNIRAINKKENNLARELSKKIFAYNLKTNEEITHFGIIAQDVIESFERHNLKWTDYNIVDFSDGKYSVNYTELAIFILAQNQEDNMKDFSVLYFFCFMNLLLLIILCYKRK